MFTTSRSSSLTKLQLQVKFTILHYGLVSSPLTSCGISLMCEVRTTKVLIWMTES